MTESNPSISERKKGLRQKMLAMRRALSANETESRSSSLKENILSLLEYKNAKKIMAFLAMKGESNLDGFIRQALLDGKEVYIPVCLPERQMEAGRLIDMEHFEKGPLGLRNLPAGYEVTSPESLDLVLIPGLAVSQEGIRLGMGAGYYDRYLARVPFEKRVAALWDFQVIPDIPSEPFDQKIAKIVTDKSVIVTKRG
ncbi:MAG: 5-formyltetrahydrofolate cyclo-ligase [Dialister sp.]|jgi:5-formyltetrahydrofolate cyclo-ligase|uniref:5-formyltetrahydrofolate cyclo-ligase n=1 Tax=Dialister TaxID=39948 RepID=UPI000D551629|nr:MULTISPECIES: 5-formyltetrahydrofolate cyclo-ligase [Dialister]MBS6412348.1 5-formyltetrahydrofolate cyclo-ligase [Dialister sp.]MCH3912626.1 5-formyltetrahydrofolate cyclo-ligase [Dialister sp.]MCH3929613.1 5-formyltetrahydrofolate cyclo-ligase [Dialister sp.]HJI43073.1 5-formyltetrahydrofolate cyclo-ligase [Veillonellaceae bacterium]